MQRLICVFLFLLGACSFLVPYAHGSSVQGNAREEPIRVASKNFTESYLLSEIMSQLLESRGFKVERLFGLGGTLVCYQALTQDAIDVYVEYTGTLSLVILKQQHKASSIPALNLRLTRDQVYLLDSFGFNNTYAMALKETLAKSEGLTKVSQLKDRPNIKYALSLEFLNREDGWPGLKQTYQLSAEPVGIEHGLAYQAIHNNKIDITDAYSTDGDLVRYRLITLEDDKKYFPQYLAAPLVRDDLDTDAVEVLNLLSGRINDDLMRSLNGKVVVDGSSFAEVAFEFLNQAQLLTPAQNSILQDSSDQSQSGRPFFNGQMLHNVIIHLQLTGIALLLGCIFGLAIGVLVFRHERASKVMVYVTGLMQTIPSIALLALMIPLFGIGMIPAIIALFLYSILPILRNTITALIGVDPLLKRVSEAIGLNPRQQVRYLLLPLALPTILAGIRTAAVISIGTATLAAFIGAGGLGEPIITGLALNDTRLILQGALPAAALAIFIEILFEGLERLIVKPHILRGQLPE